MQRQRTFLGEGMLCVLQKRLSDPFFLFGRQRKQGDRSQKDLLDRGIGMVDQKPVSGVFDQRNGQKAQDRT